MKFTFTLFTGITLLFATINFAQQPAPYAQPYQPQNESPLQPRQPTQPNSQIKNQPLQNQPLQNPPMLPTTNPQPVTGITLQNPPMQTPPKNITTNGVLTYQNQPTTPTQPTQGFNSPFPTNLTQPTNPNQPAYPTQPTNPNQPVYPTQPANPAHPNHGLYQPTPTQPNPAQPYKQPLPTSAHGGGVGAVTGGAGNNVTINDPRGGVRVADANVGRHVGHSAPVVRVHPFILKPEEQRELDEFLLRWERYSETVNNYEVDFNAFYYDPTSPLSTPVTSSDPQLKPLRIVFGYFKFVAPRKFVYHVEGEWQQKERVKYINHEITPNVFAEKTIIDGQSLFSYDFPAKKVTQYRMPPDVLNRTIANGPFPLIFGAKSDDMKKRFSMKIVTNPDYRDKEIWLWAVPLLQDDQQEFAKIEIRIDKRTLNAIALKRINSNEKSYTTYTLNNPRVNKFGAAALSVVFNPDVPRGWKLEIQDQVKTNINPTPNPTPITHTTQPTRREVPLYNP
jgi:TIGR03009 family protein